LKAPVRIDFKTSENPFEGRKSQIDERVAARKRRYVSKFKKAEKNLSVKRFKCKNPNPISVFASYTSLLFQLKCNFLLI
jgi:hypothetical protein